MGLETATYISGMVGSNPTVTDGVRQGDDHLRLIKNALQNTFPNASKPFRFPVTRSVSSNTALAGTDVSALILASAATAEVVVTLPSMAASDAGAAIHVMKTDSSANRVIVRPSSGNINGLGYGLVLGEVNECKYFWWTGTAWVGERDDERVGAYKDFAGSSVPAKYLLCDGRAISRVTYEALFNVIGGLYGSGDGSTTFNLPDFRGRVAAGLDGGSARLSAVTTVGATTGSQTHALTAAENGAHSHAAGTLAAASHTHPAGTLTLASHDHTFSGTTSGDGAHVHGGVTSTTGDHAHTYSRHGGSSTVGSGTTATIADDDYVAGAPTSTAGAHAHTLSIDSAGTHSHTFSGTTSASGILSVTGDSGGAGAAVVGDTAVSGSGSPHNNVQPTMGVNKIIFAGA